MAEFVASASCQPRQHNLTGRRFGRLVALELIGYRQNGTARSYVWRCKCDCGNVVNVIGSNLLRGATKSCKCARPAAIGAKKRRHGMTETPEYRVWSGMRTRCYNQNYRLYRDYGGRGIKICERWRTFENFIADMGQRPCSGHSIERLDNDGDYEPGNCVWSTKDKQANNKRNNRLVTAFGATKTTAQWGRVYGISSHMIFKRLGRGWESERAVSTPATRQRGVRCAEKVRATARRRYAAVRRATPIWLSDKHKAEIAAVYATAKSLGLQVDHVYPLRGKEASGLHVPWNLSPLSGSENSKKRTKLPSESATLTEQRV